LKHERRGFLVRAPIFLGQTARPLPQPLRSQSDRNKHGAYISTKGDGMGKLLAMPKTAQMVQLDETQLRLADLKNQDSAELLRDIKDCLEVLSKRAKSEKYLKMILGDIEMLEEFGHQCFDRP
jgi:hypothetical protein